MAIVEIHGLQKSFGKQEVLSSLTFCVEENRIFGFLGQNGAGKITTMNILLGLLKKDGGSVRCAKKKLRLGKMKQTNTLAMFVMFLSFMAT